MDIVTVSVRPRTNPTSEPRKPPTMTPKAAATVATTRLTQAPCRIREKVSRAIASVPSQCELEIGSSGSPVPNSPVAALKPLVCRLGSCSGSDPLNTVMSSLA